MNRLSLAFLRPGTITRISIGVAALLVMFLMALDATFGLVPDPQVHAFEIRRVESERLAERITHAAAQQGAEQLSPALFDVRAQSRALRSIGLRRKDGALLAGTPAHQARWAEHDASGPVVADGSVWRIPVRMQGQIWGQVELLFDALPGSTGLGKWLRIHTVWPALTFALMVGLMRLYLGRVLKQLDPAGNVPDRVRTAYNALAEAVVMVDAQGRVVLTNTALQSLIAPRLMPLGKRIEDNAWFREDAVFDDLPSLPWRSRLRGETTVRSARMTLAAPADIAGAQACVALVNCTPILDDRERIQGCLVVFQDQTELERAHRELQSTLVDLQLAHAQISEQHEVMLRLATLDPLTDCLNRRAFFDAGRNMMQRALMEATPISVIMLDIDHFKSVNDQHGHGIGDEVIQAVAKTLKTHARAEDLVCRYGGEEFCMLVPEADDKFTMALAERIRLAIAAVRGIGGREKALKFTASLGVATLRGQSLPLETLIDRADEALYVSKHQGRNRVTLSRYRSASKAPAANEVEGV